MADVHCVCTPKKIAKVHICSGATTKFPVVRSEHHIAFFFFSFKASVNGHSIFLYACSTSAYPLVMCAKEKFESLGYEVSSKTNHIVSIANNKNRNTQKKCHTFKRNPVLKMKRTRNKKRIRK